MDPATIVYTIPLSWYGVFYSTYTTEGFVVEFKPTMGGFEVLVNGRQFGWISKDQGFFTDSTVIRDFLVVSHEDLREIATKAEFVTANLPAIGSEVFALEGYDVSRYIVTGHISHNLIRVVLASDTGPCPLQYKISQWWVKHEDIPRHLFGAAC